MSKSKSREICEKKKLVVVFTHTNYELISGGTEKFVREYAALIRSQNAVDLTIFPLAHRGKNYPFYVGILFKGKFLGIYNADRIEKVIIWHIRKYDLVFSCVVIQHLKNSNLGIVLRVIEYFKAQTFLFIHDFYSICCNTRLISDDGEHCGFDIPSEYKCHLCSMKSEGIAHYNAISLFYEKIDKYLSKVYVPSEFVAEKILMVFPQWMNKIEVRPHLILSGFKKHKLNNGKIKIAYVGAQIDDKGYDKWIYLVKQLSEKCSEDYEFYYFGYGSDRLPGVINIYAAESTGQKMENLLMQNNIDIAFFWTKCGETYSYVYYEMSLAGVFVVTNNRSGNVACEVSKNENGIIFSCIEDVVDWFINSKVVRDDVHYYRVNGRYKPEFKCINDYIDLPVNYKLTGYENGCNRKHVVLTILYYVKHIVFNKGERKII